MIREFSGLGIDIGIHLLRLGVGLGTEEIPGLSLGRGLGKDGL